MQAPSSNSGWDQPVAKHRPRRNLHQPHDEHVYYLLEVVKWEWKLSFGVAPPVVRDPDPYSDVRHLAIRAQFLRPRKLAEWPIELTFIPTQHRNEERRQNCRPQHIGSMSLRGEAQAILSLPEDALPSLLPMLIGERFKYLVLHGTALRYRKASVRSFHFRMQINEDEWPLDD
jgi:hypothetical protein